ncbi:MAG TPA: Asp23/Gls24 family envelope stress response protein [Calditerricola sp.]
MGRGEDVRIADDVVALIAGIAAADTDGVVRMASGRTEDWARRVRGRNAHRGVAVDVNGEEVTLDLRVIVAYGTKIDHVCRRLQQNVKDAVERMTGLRVVEVNVRVEGVDWKA